MGPVAFDGPLEEGRTRLSISTHSRLIWLFETPDMPRALDQRVDRARRDTPHKGFLDHGRQCLLHHTPPRKAWEAAAFLSLGMSRSTVPARVSRTRSRYPSRCASRTGERSPEAAPVRPCTSSSSQHAGTGRSCRRSSWWSPGSGCRSQRNPTEDPATATRTTTRGRDPRGIGAGLRLAGGKLLAGIGSRGGLQLDEGTRACEGKCFGLTRPPSS
jgi:hypothetical protein